MTGYSFTQSQQERLGEIGEYSFIVQPATDIGDKMEVVVDYYHTGVRLVKVTEKHKSYYEVSRRNDDGWQWDTFDSFDEAFSQFKDWMDKEDRNL